MGNDAMTPRSISGSSTGSFVARPGDGQRLGVVRRANGRRRRDGGGRSSPDNMIDQFAAAFSF
jgi:hypothetical protein